MIAVHPENDPNGEGWAIAKAWASATGGDRAGVLRSSFVAEVKSDLMGEQTILCGVLQAASILCFDRMVELGMDKAYACKLIQYGWETVCEALKQGGITNMMDRLSNPAKIRACELADELAISGAELLIETINNFDNITPQKQDDAKATKAPMMNKEMGLINWNNDACYIERMVRAFTPWPASYTNLDDKKVKIFKTKVYECSHNQKAGTVIDVKKDSFIVACKTNALEIFELQIEGKKRMDTKSFLAGFKLQTGALFS